VKTCHRKSEHAIALSRRSLFLFFHGLNELYDFRVSRDITVTGYCRLISAIFTSRTTRVVPFLLENYVFNSINVHNNNNEKLQEMLMEDFENQTNFSIFLVFYSCKYHLKLILIFTHTHNSCINKICAQLTIWSEYNNILLFILYIIYLY